MERAIGELFIWMSIGKRHKEQGSLDACHSDDSRKGVENAAKDVVARQGLGVCGAHVQQVNKRGANVPLASSAVLATSPGASATDSHPSGFGVGIRMLF